MPAKVGDDINLTGTSLPDTTPLLLPRVLYQEKRTKETINCPRLSNCIILSPSDGLTSISAFFNFCF